MVFRNGEHNRPMQVRRTGLMLKSDCRKVLLRPFEVADTSRIKKIIGRIMSMTEAEAVNQYQMVLSGFSDRHREIEDFFHRRFTEVSTFIPGGHPCSKERSLLIGAYFSHEYSYQAAALFNPSIVWHPDQSGLPAGSKRFIMSLRATGEGHISSLTFRTGIIDKENNIELAETGRYPETADKANDPVYDLSIVKNLAGKSGLPDDRIRKIFTGLGSVFTRKELELKLASTADDGKEEEIAVQSLLSMLYPEYQLRFDSRSDISERVIFPITLSESNGIEDARFVYFQDGENTRYYATYTAYNKHRIRVKLLKTTDFIHFSTGTLSGPAIENKGIALFPEKINGKYAMLSRQDNENNLIMYSDDLYYWSDKKIIQRPAFSWEFIQLGNCGSPVETEKGWLVFSHGVGAMRTYSIGAFLLDHDNPTKLIGRTSEPLLIPEGSEREGYVPNVVYSCGAVIHGPDVILPYAVSDSATSIALISLNELLGAMQIVG